MINQIVLSCNEDPTYREFWPLTARAYKLLFPDIRVHLAFLTNRTDNDEMVREMRQHGDVTLFPILSDIPEFGQAKMIRFILAAEQGTDVCYIDDIDLIPLQREFITNAVIQRPENVLLCVGAEVYGWQGTCPVSQMTAEGHVWKRLINPKNLNYSDLIHSWTGYFYDVREKINVEQTLTAEGFKDDIYFSDERLIRRLLRETPVPIINVPRGYADYLDATIDRATVDSKTGIWRGWTERESLAGKYVNVHGARPVSKYEKEYGIIMGYLEEKHGKE